MTIALFWVLVPEPPWTRTNWTNWTNWTKWSKRPHGCACECFDRSVRGGASVACKGLQTNFLPRPQTPLEEAASGTASGNTNCPFGFKVIVTPFWLYALTLPRFLVPHLAMLNPGL